jgi:hypothetical protein
MGGDHIFQSQCDSMAVFLLLLPGTRQTARYINMTVISVIVGSTREGRFSEKPAKWILQSAGDDRRTRRWLQIAPGYLGGHDHSARSIDAYRVLGGLAEFERELIRTRTGEGRERAKARGGGGPRPQAQADRPSAQRSNRSPGGGRGANRHCTVPQHDQPAQLSG